MLKLISHYLYIEPTIGEYMEEKKSLLSLLTEDEREIMELYIIGMKNNQICKRINISKYFLLQKVKSVIKKINAQNRIHAIALVTNEIEKQNIDKTFKHNEIKTEKNIFFKLNLTINFFNEKII